MRRRPAKCRYLFTTDFGETMMIGTQIPRFRPHISHSASAVRVTYCVDDGTIDSFQRNISIACFTALKCLHALFR